MSMEGHWEPAHCTFFCDCWYLYTRREENCFAGGGGDGTEAHLPNPPPPPPWSPCREGGLGWGCPTCRAGGGGGPTPTYMAQNNPHVALIILTTHMWGKFFE